jgi:hypothetical protein
MASKLGQYLHAKTTIEFSASLIIYLSILSKVNITNQGLQYNPRSLFSAVHELQLDYLNIQFDGQVSRHPC